MKSQFVEMPLQIPILILILTIIVVFVTATVINIILINHVYICKIAHRR